MSSIHVLLAVLGTTVVLVLVARALRLRVRVRTRVVVTDLRDVARELAPRATGYVRLAGERTAA